MEGSGGVDYCSEVKSVRTRFREVVVKVSGDTRSEFWDEILFRSGVSCMTGVFTTDFQGFMQQTSG